MKKLLLLLFASAVTCASSIKSVSPLPKVIDLRWLDDAVAKSNSLTVFEGLPHQTFEPKERAAEIARVPTFEVSDQFFYLRTLDVSPTDQGKLMELFVSKGVAIPPPVEGLPMKFCGGFHADYAIRWAKDGEALVHTLICFGCHEMRIVQGSLIVNANMTKEGYEALWKLLTPYRQERPSRRLETAEKSKVLPPKPPVPKIEYKP